MNGLLILDKPAGMTSHDVVNRVRRATGEASTGHLGTLDPMATGVLPLLLGRYTRLAQFFGAMEKSYTGTIRFGYSTDTYDAEGAPTSSVVPAALSLEAVRAAAREFSGEMLQTPPAFSAKKVGGTPSYKLARAGNAKPLKPVRIFIHEFTIANCSGDLAEFAIRVSAGGYVRSVAHELGQRLGCGSHLASLRRTAAGRFTLKDALTLDQLAELAQDSNLEAWLPHPRSLLPDLPSVTADLVTAGRLRNGVAVNLPDFSAAPLVKVFSNQRNLVAIGKRIAGTLFQPMVVVG
ncbi:tRNA pseudouridine synthase B [Acidisarcina polymorpha]|uniref:tRNA pseudouridine synthase B n=1 Tax=Acidisarcina polymorpha TaxID=2211140 RepID=A0A2Z5G711_9BACT|nr:tRNA pseudouridine(55) synthase TruB [Acidisarcina polymorpha]AXC14871.1 tRNA pseudouridine synthase B [Acidisarcina polymorpha]